MHEVESISEYMHIICFNDNNAMLSIALLSLNKYNIYNNINKYLSKFILNL